LEHSTIALNFGAELRSALRGKPRQPYESNLRVLTPESRRYVYPDLSVICGPAEFDPADEQRHTAINPTVVVEVLSPSTEQYDRTAKFDRYREIGTLREYVLVAQEQPRVETFRRGEDGAWRFDVAVGLHATVRLGSIGVEIRLAEIYDRITFPPPEPEPEPESKPGEGTKGA
jgi:Uma2 family endonuclease